MSIKANVDIRQKAHEKGVSIWELADGLGLAETTFYRRLRHELSEAEKHHIMEVIEKIAKGA